ncbi:MAG TPA: Calx-beta domain-containing protein [Frankiaceae bacterium]|nr:Calx-beta domain-containing protein [Frankiaceae bacterium]
MSGWVRRGLAGRDGGRRAGISEPSARYVEIAGVLVDGTAVAGADYGPDTFAGTIVFAGETTSWIDVALLDDAEAEGPETFGFRLTHVIGAVPDPAQQVVVATITDDD